MIKQILKSIYSRLYYVEFYMFHSVDNEKKHQTCFNLTENFHHIMEECCSQIIAIDEFNHLSWKDKNKKILITFDDGFDDFYTQAFPILKELKLPFVLFISTENINKEGYLTLHQIKEICKYNGCTIGSHGVHHTKFSEMTLQEVEYEMCHSKKEIESIIEKKCEYIAYPFGANNHAVRRLARKYYKLGFAVSGQRATCIGFLGGGGMMIPRMDMSETG